MLFAFATNLTSDDRDALEVLPSCLTSHAAQEILSTEGLPTRHVGIIVSGFASRFKIVRGNTRQTIGFLLPGDTIDLPSMLTGKPSAHVIANVQSTVCWVDQIDLRRLCFTRPDITKSLWLDTLISAGIAQEWIANIGQRNARDRLAHLLLELAARQESIGAFRNNVFELPLSQNEIARAVGLSLVHTNKSLRALEISGLVRKKGHLVEMLDRAMLSHQVGFDPAYLSRGFACDQAVSWPPSSTPNGVLPEQALIAAG